MTAQVGLLATGLKKRYGTRQVVTDVSFSVRPGEVVGLLGPNGAGKTTSFNMVAGLVMADEGAVFLGERRLDGLPLYRRARLGLGYLPQETTVFRGLSARDNLRAVLEARGLSFAERARTADALLAQYRLTQAAETCGADLSGGERRRLELARALALEPQVLLLDEPFAGVDPIAVQDIQALIRGVAQEGIGILLTDHNVRETLSLVDRAYLMADGQILVEGDPAAIVESEAARRAYLGQNFRL